MNKTSYIDPDSLRDDVNKLLKTGKHEGDVLELDVAIVGAGMSGLYSAYRLSSDYSYKDKKIHIFELSNRIAGRLFTVKLPETDHVYGELGGMRYLKTQEIVRALIEDHFKLDSIKFKFGTEPDVQKHLIAYYRGERYHAYDWKAHQDKGEVLKTCYKLRPEHEGLSSDQMFNKIIEKILTSDPWFNENFESKLIPSKYDCDFENLSREDWDVIKPQLTYHRKDSPYNGIKLE
jgi:protoporphyrinogen oxidase